MARPKSKAALSTVVAEEKSCGYIMHQVKRLRCKMRWGELLLGKDKAEVNWCQIALFKFDLTNPKLGMLAKKDMKLKASFSFSEEDFCGLEKGQHITKHGTKRYICIILKDQHIIFQDAIIAMTNADHDIIQTWYRKITNSMRYLYRWKILSIHDARFLHVSKLNTSVCLSLHNSNEGMRGQILLQVQYKTGMIEKVEEQQEKQPDGSPCTRAVMHIRDVDKNVCFILESGKSLSDVIKNINHVNSVGFDMLDYQNPNLVRIPQHPKKVAGTTKSLRQLTDDNKSPKPNAYISNTVHLPTDEKENSLQAGVDHPPTDTLLSSASALQHNMTAVNDAMHGLPLAHNGLNVGPLIHPNQPWAAQHHSHAPPRIPPREPNDDLKKASDTRVTFDSGFHTSDCILLSNSTQYSYSHSTGNANPMAAQLNSPYVNMAEFNASASPSLSQSIEAPLPSSVSQVDAAPELPPRDIPITTPTNHSVDLIERALRSQSLPPLDPNPDARLPGYENSLSVEVTIDLVLHRNHGDNIDVSLGLPHSAYLAIVLGLENNTVADGDWRGLASALAMTFEDVMQIEAATQHRERLYPAHIVLVHWFRTQAPYAFNRSSLKGILAQIMNRLDLANMIPPEENNEHRHNV